MSSFKAVSFTLGKEAKQQASILYYYSVGWQSKIIVCVHGALVVGPGCCCWREQAIWNQMRRRASETFQIHSPYSPSHAVAIHGWNREMGDERRSWDLIALMLWLQQRCDEPPRPILMSQTASFLSSSALADRPTVGRLDYTNRSILVWNEGVCAARLFHQSLEMSSTGSVARELLQQQQQHFDARVVLPWRPGPISVNKLRDLGKKSSNAQSAGLCRLNRRCVVLAPTESATDVERVIIKWYWNHWNGSFLRLMNLGRQCWSRLLNDGRPLSYSRLTKSSTYHTNLLVPLNDLVHTWLRTA